MSARSDMEAAKAEFIEASALLVNAGDQHPGDSARVLAYALKMVMADRKFVMASGALPMPPQKTTE